MYIMMVYMVCVYVCGLYTWEVNSYPELIQALILMPKLIALPIHSPEHICKVIENFEDSVFRLSKVISNLYVGTKASIFSHASCLGLHSEMILLKYSLHIQKHVHVLWYVFNVCYVIHMNLNKLYFSSIIPRIA